jgi:short-subunit dehydrogenase
LLNALGEFRNVLLVGANSDIGANIVCKLPLASDANLMLIAKSENIHPLLLNLKVNKKLLTLDLSSEFNSVEALKFTADGKDIDLAIIAIGILKPRNLEEDQSFPYMAAVNYVNSLEVIMECAKIMRKQGSGKIIVLSSFSAIKPRKATYLYGSTKAGLEFAIKGLTREFAKDNVQIHLFRLGFIFTKMTSNLKPAIFASTPQRESDRIVNLTLKKSKKMYTSRKFQILGALMLVTPTWVLDRLEKD